jgi:hypothetical protein
MLALPATQKMRVTERIKQRRAEANLYGSQVLVSSDAGTDIGIRVGIRHPKPLPLHIAFVVSAAEQLLQNWAMRNGSPLNIESHRRRLPTGAQQARRMELIACAEKREWTVHILES